MTDEDKKTQAALVRVEQRLSQLEGSTRAALAKIDTALARHDGDVAELRAGVRVEARMTEDARTEATIETVRRFEEGKNRMAADLAALRDRVRLLEDARHVRELIEVHNARVNDDLGERLANADARIAELTHHMARAETVAENRKLVIDQVREALGLVDGDNVVEIARRIQGERDEALYALRRACDVAGIFPGVGANELPEKVNGTNLAKHPAADGPSLVDDLRARLEHFSTKLTEARAEQEADLDAIFEALGAARVRLTGWIARDEWALAIKMAREIRAERDALKKREPIRIETADGDLAARLADVTKARDVVAEQRDAHAEIISAVAFELKRDQHDRVEVGEIVGRVQRMKAEALRLGNERNDARRAIDAIRKLAT